MCGTCGCSPVQTVHEEHEHHLADGTVVRHSHEPPGAAHPLGEGASAHGHGANETELRRIRVEQDLLAANDRVAAENRRVFAEAGTLALNLMSSPGSGKTTVLVRTIGALGGRAALAVIEGDQQTDLDAKRIEATGVKVAQVNTGKGCHLDAALVARALARVSPPPKGLLFIENVGNLVCPAAFDLGEAKRVVVVSVTEGEDKPLKYPDMFATADLVLVNKVDLVPHLDFDVARLVANIRRVKAVPVFLISARSGEGFGDWLGWLEQLRGGPRPA